MIPPRIVFMGTPPLAATVLEALLGARQFDVVTAVTQPDQPKGRELRLQPSAVKELAFKRSLPVLQPERARDPQFIEAIRQLAPDLIVVNGRKPVRPRGLDRAAGCPDQGAQNGRGNVSPFHR